MNFRSSGCISFLRVMRTFYASGVWETWSVGALWRAPPLCPFGASCFLRAPSCCGVVTKYTRTTGLNGGRNPAHYWEGLKPGIGHGL